MANVPKNLKYTKEHEWIKIENDIAIIGITDYAQSQLGDIVYVELPKLNQKYQKGESIAVVENEWGYAKRVVDLVEYIIERGDLENYLISYDIK